MRVLESTDDKGRVIYMVGDRWFYTKSKAQKVAGEKTGKTSRKPTSRKPPAKAPIGNSTEVTARLAKLYSTHLPPNITVKATGEVFTVSYKNDRDLASVRLAPPERKNKNWTLDLIVDDEEIAWDDVFKISAALERAVSLLHSIKYTE